MENEKDESTLSQIKLYLKTTKRWWLLPIIILLIITSLFIIVGTANNILTPFIYALG